MGTLSTTKGSEIPWNRLKKAMALGLAQLVAPPDVTPWQIVGMPHPSSSDPYTRYSRPLRQWLTWETHPEELAALGFINGHTKASTAPKPASKPASKPKSLKPAKRSSYRGLSVGDTVKVNGKYDSYRKNMIGEIIAINKEQTLAYCVQFKKNGVPIDDSGDELSRDELHLVKKATRRRLNLRSQDLLKSRLFNLLRSPALKPFSPDSKRRAGVN